ncbi:MAG: hypothetical protein WC211_07285 [Dehalococcoidia bacterium]
MNPQSVRFAWIAFVLLWLSIVTTQPRSAAAFEVPPDISLGPSLHAALSQLEFTLPARDGAHTVEFWNGVVCEDDTVHPDNYHCVMPGDIGE